MGCVCLSEVGTSPVLKICHALWAPPSPTCLHANTQAHAHTHNNTIYTSTPGLSSLRHNNFTLFRTPLNSHKQLIFGKLAASHAHSLPWIHLSLQLLLFSRPHTFPPSPSQTSRIWFYHKLAQHSCTPTQYGCNFPLSLLNAEKRLPDLQLKSARRLVRWSGRQTQTPRHSEATGHYQHRAKPSSDTVLLWWVNREATIAMKTAVVQFQSTQKKTNRTTHICTKT